MSWVSVSLLLLPQLVFDSFLVYNKTWTVLQVYKHKRMINGQNKEEGIKEIGPTKIKKNLHLRRTSLASVESLTMPQVQEVVLLADFQCAWCQRRVGDIIDRMNGEMESVTMSVLEKKVTLTFTNTNYDSSIVETPPLHQVSVHLKPLSKFSLIKRLLFGYAKN